MANFNLSVAVGANLSDFEKGMQQVKNRVTALSADLQKVGENLTKYVTVPLTGLAVVGVRAFDTQIKAEERLRSAIKANGREVNDLFKDYAKFASGLQEVTTIGDETTLAMLQVAESMGLTGESAKRAVRNAIAMQGAFGTNAQSAIRYTSALEMGDSVMLGRYIPALKQITDESERTAMAQRILGNAFSSATAEAQVGLGPLQQLQNDYGDLMEQIGKLISGAINPLIERLNALVVRLKATDDRTLALYTGIGLLVAGIGPAILLFNGLNKALTLANAKMLAITASVIALSAGFIYVAKNLNAFKDFFVVTFIEIQNAMVDSMTSMILSLANFAGSVANVIPGMRVLQQEMLSFAMSTQTMKATVTGAGAEFQNFQEFVDSLADSFEKLFNIVSGGGEGGEGGMESFGTSMEESKTLLSELSIIGEQFVTSFSTGLGEAVVEAKNFEDMLVRIGDMLKQVGKELLKSGIARLATIFLTGGVGAGAGFFGSGGGLFGAIGGLLPGAKSFTPSTPALTGQNINVGGSFILRGQDLVLAMNRTQDFITR